MLLPRILRPLVAYSASVPLLSTRLILPLPIRTRTRCLTTTAEPSNSSSPATPPPSLEPASSSIPAKPQTPLPLPYFVGRNNFNNLSVYQRKKRGGNLKLTLVKRGEGDLMALKQDIREALQLDQNDVSINNVNKHIVIRVSEHYSLPRV
ncbi:hypothetical protein F4819DRAFT_481045, partial [Hypoxylon fuscum]